MPGAGAVRSLSERRFAAPAAAGHDRYRGVGALARLVAYVRAAARRDRGRHPLALVFPFTNPAVTSVLFGATSPEQVRADCAAVGLLGRLSQADVADLRRIGRPEPPPAVP